MPRTILVPIALAIHGALATPIRDVSKRATTPAVASATLLGIATDPYWNRDSCTSVLAGYRALWTCRDSSGQGGEFYSSTASWTNFTNGVPNVYDGTLLMYGNDNAEFFANQPDECGGPAGNCNDGTRWAIWQNAPPLPVTANDTGINFYTWIDNVHLNNTSLAQLNSNPPTSLYKTYYDETVGDLEALPPTSLINEEFWGANAIPYGAYGWAISSDSSTAYLFGQLNGSSARTVASVPIGSIEDTSAYSFWTADGWSSTAPDINDQTAAVPNAGTGGQGTFYYSSYFGSYVWIGGSSIGVGPEFYITTAPDPTGPWSEPVLFYTGINGDGSLGSYSQQAHPGLSIDNGNGNDIYLTFTQVNSTADGSTSDSTPLIHIVWQ